MSVKPTLLSIITATVREAARLQLAESTLAVLLV